MKPASKLILSLTLFAGLGSAPVLAETPAVAPASGAACVAETAGWKAREADNIAGLRDLKKVSNPAIIDYEQLLAATVEMQELKREKIDPDSPKGRSLRQQASERVTKATEVVRKDKRHCSVWKAIRHTDGRKVTDITRAVMGKLGSG